MRTDCENIDPKYRYSLTNRVARALKLQGYEGTQMRYRILMGFAGFTQHEVETLEAWMTPEQFQKQLDAEQAASECSVAS